MQSELLIWGNLKLKTNKKKALILVITDWTACQKFLANEARKKGEVLNRAKKPLLFWWVAANMIFYSVSFVLFFHSIVCEYFEVLPCLSTLVAPRIQIDLPVREKQFDTFPKKMHWRSFCMSFSSKEYIFRRKRSRYIKCIPQKFAFYEYWNDGKFTRPKSWYSNSRGNKVDKHGNARSKQTNNVYRSRYFISPIRWSAELNRAQFMMKRFFFKFLSAKIQNSIKVFVSAIRKLFFLMLMKPNVQNRPPSLLSNQCGVFSTLHAYLYMKIPKEKFPYFRIS